MDRVYDSSLAKDGSAGTFRFGFGEVLAQMDRRSRDVLPPCARISSTSE
jgi:hypothetical protein